MDLDQKHAQLPAYLHKRQHPDLHYLLPLIDDMRVRRRERDTYDAHWLRRLLWR